MLPYKYFMIFESILKVDPQFLQIIKTLQSSGDLIASALSNLIENDIKTNLNYIRPGKANDELVFINDTQVKRITDAGQNPFEKTGNVAKVGRAIRQILDANTIKIVDKDIEDFVNKYKNAWDDLFDENKNEKIRLVKGEDIRYWYLEDKYLQGGGTLNNSCMRYANTQTFLNIYVENPNSVNLLIYLDDDKKLKGRSLVWFYEKDGTQKVYQDRIYTTNDSDRISMHNWFLDKYKDGLSYQNGDYGKDISVKLDKFIFKEYPYMDSICYLDFKLGFIRTKKDNNNLCYSLRATNGTYNVDGHYWSSYQNEWIPERYAAYISIKKPNSNEEIGYVHVNICVIDYSGEYILKDRAVESKLYGLLDIDNGMETEKWGIIPKNCLIDVVTEIDGSGKRTTTKMPDKLIGVEFAPTIYTERVYDNLIRSGSSLYAINELSFKTLIGRLYIKPESSWLSDKLNIKNRLCEVVKVKNNNCVTKRVERFSIKYPHTYYLGDSAVGFYISDSAATTSSDYFYTIQLYVDKYNLEKISDDIEYFSLIEFYYNLYFNDIVTNDILDSFDGEEKENLKKADTFFCNYSSGYIRRKNEIVFVKTYNRENTMEKLNEYISRTYLKFHTRLTDAINFDDNTVLDRRDDNYRKLEDAKDLKRDLIEKISSRNSLNAGEVISYIKNNFSDVEYFLYILYIIGMDYRERLSRNMFEIDSAFYNLYTITYSGSSSFGDNFYHTVGRFYQGYKGILNDEQGSHLTMLCQDISGSNIPVSIEKSKSLFLNFKEKYLTKAV